MDDIGYDERLSRRRKERERILPLSALDQLDAGIAIVYLTDGRHVEELPDGRRYVVELVDLGRSALRLHEI